MLSTQLLRKVFYLYIEQPSNIFAHVNFHHRSLKLLTLLGSVSAHFRLLAKNVISDFIVSNSVCIDPSSFLLTLPRVSSSQNLSLRYVFEDFVPVNPLNILSLHLDVTSDNATDLDVSSYFHAYNFSRLQNLSLNFINRSTNLDSLFGTISAQINKIESLSLEGVEVVSSSFSFSSALSSLNSLVIKSWTCKHNSSSLLLDVGNLTFLESLSVHAKLPVVVKGLSKLPKLMNLHLFDVIQIDSCHKNARLRNCTLSYLTVSLVNWLVQNQSNLIDCKFHVLASFLQDVDVLAPFVLANLLEFEAIPWALNNSTFSTSTTPRIEKVSFPSDTLESQDVDTLLFSNCPRLQSIDIECFSALSITVSQTLFVSHISLKGINVLDVVSLLSQCPYVKNLHIEQARGSAELTFLSSLRLPYLSTLSLSWCNNFYQYLPPLNRLLTLKVESVNDFSFVPFSVKFPQLYSCSISQCTFNTSHCSPNFSLKYLTISNCRLDSLKFSHCFKGLLNTVSSNNCVFDS
ncbi:hypothetical protein RCL1_001923 [Eukaryota sp. TZLM3-RCL]